MTEPVPVPREDEHQALLDWANSVISAAEALIAQTGYAGTKWHNGAERWRNSYKSFVNRDFTQQGIK